MLLKTKARIISKELDVYEHRFRDTSKYNKYWIIMGDFRFDFKFN